jgi:hypothetical protein
LLDTVGLYCSVGLEDAERCLCFCPPEWHARIKRLILQRGVDPEAALTSGSMTLQSSSILYLPARRLNGSAQLERTMQTISRLTAGDCRAARAFGIPPRGHSRRTAWWEYEQAVTEAVARTRVTVLCGYWPEGADTGVWQKARACHPLAIEQGALAQAGRVQ